MHRANSTTHIHRTSINWRRYARMRMIAMPRTVLVVPWDPQYSQPTSAAESVPGSITRMRTGVVSAGSLSQNGTVLAQVKLPAQAALFHAAHQPRVP